jgi:hypothetical protein
MTLSRRIGGVFLAGVLSALTACSGADPAGVPTSPTAGASAPATGSPSATTSPATTGAPAPEGPRWSANPVIVVHDPPVPPLPVLTRMRWAAHPGFDRIVFDFRGPLPGYDIRYVSQFRADPSDRPVSVPGRRFLRIAFRPAQAHHNTGAPTVSGARRLDLPMLRGYAVGGDFEGVVSIALGLDDVVGYRVGELPGRIYVDVAA